LLGRSCLGRRAVALGRLVGLALWWLLGVALLWGLRGLLGPRLRGMATPGRCLGHLAPLVG